MIIFLEAFDIVAWMVKICILVTTVECRSHRLSGISADSRSAIRNISTVYPFVVGLTSSTPDDQIICTGTLVSPVFVLSTAHCTSRLTGIKVYRWKKSAQTADYRRASEVYVHPSYDSTKRVADLSLIKLNKAFRKVNSFVKITGPPKALKDDVELECVVVGIGAPSSRDNDYGSPVRVKFGRSACQIPKLNPGIKYVIADTWAEFLCTRTESPSYLPCDRGDPLICESNVQFGVTSYGYSTETSREADGTECGDPTVQSRHLFVNNYAHWIMETISNRTNTVGHPKTTVSTTTEHTTSSIRGLSVEEDEDLSNIHSKDSYPYLVYLESYPDEPVCGGTLISALHVLTSAYCTTRMSSIEVYLLAGSHRQRTNASSVHIHPDFEAETLTADISIVVLSEPFNVTRYAQFTDSVRLSDNNKTKVLDCVVVAKRRLGPYRHDLVKGKYGPHACRETTDSDVQSAVSRTWSDFICGAPKSTRQSDNDDTGDPLICDGLQFGITSHSYRLAATGDEATAKQVRYLLVNKYKRWIDQVVAESSSSAASASVVGFSRPFRFFHRRHGPFFCSNDVYVFITAASALLFG